MICITQGSGNLLVNSQARIVFFILHGNSLMSTQHGTSVTRHFVAIEACCWTLIICDWAVGLIIQLLQDLLRSIMGNSLLIVFWPHLHDDNLTILCVIHILCVAFVNFSQYVLCTVCTLSNDVTYSFPLSNVNTNISHKHHTAFKKNSFTDLFA